MFIKKISSLILIILVISTPVFGQIVVDVKPGDTLWSIAQKYLGSGELWPVLARYNQLKNPHLVYQRNKIEIPCLSKVKLTETFGQVRIKKKGEASFVEAKEGMFLETSDEIKTEADSRAQIEIDEKSFIQIKPNTMVKIDKLLTCSQKEGVSARLKLFFGRIFLQCPKGSESEVETPGLLCGVRGTQLQTSHKEGSSSIVAVFDGKVAAEAQGKLVEVAAGYGSKAVQGQAPSLPTKLPLPPPLALPEDMMAASNKRPAFSWQPVSNAAGYHFELAKDTDFNQVIWEVEGTSSLNLIPSFNLPERQYYWHVSSIDQQGIEGGFSHCRLLKIITKRLNLSLVPDPPIYIQKGINFASDRCIFHLKPINIEEHVGRIMIDIDGQGFQVYCRPISFKEQGSHTILYYPVDLLGCRGETEEFKVIIETGSPEVEIIADKVIKLDNDVYALKENQFSLFAEDTGIGVEKIVYALNQEEYQEYKCPFSIAGLPDGRHKIRFKARDFVGNWSEEKEFLVAIDSVPPCLDINLSTPQKKKGLSGQPISFFSILLTLSADDPVGVSKILLEVDGGGLKEYKEPLVIDSTKSHRFRCRVEDKLGNWQEKEFTSKKDYRLKIILLLLAVGGYGLF
ncbi:FecR domain-containing protein [Candidatus Desantisbacteria bacterium]|nr:FecR domain-containing protein [Candidatus Desantisbacteria bacterium]